jgi:two-component system, chemotaxis family, chemotaxis protein CheY
MAMGTKVLVVDDSMMIRQQVGTALIAAGFDVVDAKDGLDALEQLKAHKDVEVVVCDVNMPTMNGLEFLESLRSDSALSDIPVMMLTTESQFARIQRAKVLGAKAWILKPFKPDLLIAAVKKLTGAEA